MPNEPTGFPVEFLIGKQNYKNNSKQDFIIQNTFTCYLSEVPRNSGRMMDFFQHNKYEFESWCCFSERFFFICVVSLKYIQQDFPGGTVDGNPPANARGTGLIPVWEDSTCHEATKPMHHNY